MTFLALKPSNIFLVGADPAHTKLLDFGIAHLNASSKALTRTGAIVGTLAGNSAALSHAPIFEMAWPDRKLNRAGAQSGE